MTGPRLAAAVLACATILAILAAGADPALARSNGRAAADRALDQAAAREPMTLVVSLAGQTIDVWRGDTLLHSSRVSTGRKGYETPPGVYSILQKKKWHRSNIYSAAPMPFMQRLTWSGIALHAGQLPGYPASHGCIRLLPEFATRLFGLTEIGAHVVIVQERVAPAAFAHAGLVQPAAGVPLPSRPLDGAQAAEGPVRLAHASALAGGPADAAAAPAADPGAAQTDPGAAQTDPAPPGAYRPLSSAPLRILVTRRTGRERVMDAQRLLGELGFDPGAVDGLMGRDTGAAIRAFQASRGLAETGAFSDDLVGDLHAAAGKGEVLDGHIYVRQDFRPVFDAPIALRAPERPLGTHLFMARDFAPGAASAQWLALTPEPAAGAPAPDAADALERVVLPDDIRRLLARMLTPRSSLIVSDHGLGGETAPRGTDFIVLTK